jgi:hypothetical protein
VRTPSLWRERHESLPTTSSPLKGSLQNIKTMATKFQHEFERINHIQTIAESNWRVVLVWGKGLGQKCTENSPKPVVFAFS